MWHRKRIALKRQLFTRFPSRDSNAGQPDVTDESDAAPTVSFTDGISGECPRVIRREWLATDACGNMSVCAQTITDYRCTQVGDMNGDGVVNESDVEEFVELLLSAELGTGNAADVNSDGIADGRDVPSFVSLLGV